jgi:hypothetical protein
MTGTDFFFVPTINKVAQLLRSAACLHTNQSQSYLNHLVIPRPSERLGINDLLVSGR